MNTFFVRTIRTNIDGIVEIRGHLMMSPSVTTVMHAFPDTVKIKAIRSITNVNYVNNVIPVDFVKKCRIVNQDYNMYAVSPA